jgi:hypothetical protein
MSIAPDLNIGDQANMFTLKLQNVLDLNVVNNQHARPTFM